MAIYSKPVRLLMKDMAAELAAAPGTVFARQQVIGWFAQHYPRIKTGTISAHLIRLSTNAQSRTHYNARPTEDDVFFQIDGSHFRLYDAAHDPPPIYAASAIPGIAEPPPEDDGDEANVAHSSGQFAYESDLRNYLARNLSIFESGLRLYEDEGITGIEFPVGGRFIDILAVALSGDLVVIELKVSRGYDRVVGQLMRYMAWIRKNQADAQQRVRGVIVAREISEDLLLACSLLPDVQLYEYQLALNLKQVNTRSASL
jgi:endonuclease